MSDGPQQADGEQAEKRASRRGFRVVFAGYLVVTIAFIVWTAKLVIIQIFVDGRVPSRGEVLPPLPPACETGLRGLGEALDLGLRAAMWADDEESAAKRFQAAIAPGWRDHEAVARACGVETTGTAAYAAVVRQRRVQEGWARRHARETVTAAAGARRFLPFSSDR